MKAFSIEEAVKFGWNKTRANFTFLLKIILIMAAVYIVGGAIQKSVADVDGLDLLVNILIWVLHMVLDIGLIKIALKFAAGQTPNLEDLYNHYPLFWKYLGGAIISFFIILGGFILLIIPGIIFAIRLQFVSYLIIDKGMGPIEAIKKSWNLTKGNTLKLLLFGLTLLGINILGVLALLIGLLWAIPTCAIATAYVYRKLTTS